MSSLTKYEPGRNEPCLCGSGSKFKKCCMGSYSSDAANDARNNFNQGLYEEALRSYRQFLTWYRLCHQAHTVPFLRSKTKESADLLKIDIEALAEILGLLHLCYLRTGQSEGFPSVLEYLSNAIADPRWKSKITYLLALWWLVDKGDRAAALTLVSEIDIANCEDPEILELYLDVSPPELPFKTKVDILDRIVANTHRASDVLQYTMIKGIAYCLINEIPQGCQIMSEAISQYRGLAVERRTSNGDWHLARGLQLLGEFEGKTTLVRDSITHYIALQQEINDKKYTAAYSAEIEKSLGDCWSFLVDYDEADRHYEASLKQEPTDLTRVFLARAQANLGDMKAARKTLLSVNSSQLNVHEHYDFAMSWACLAMRSLDSKDIETAKLHLKKAQSFWPIFTSQRDSVLIGLLEMSPRKMEGGFKNLIRILNRYVSLNPNVFGIGINLNRILDDVVAMDTNNMSDKTS